MQILINLLQTEHASLASQESLAPSALTQSTCGQVQGATFIEKRVQKFSRALCMLCTKNVELFMKVSVHELKALITLEQENISVAEKTKNLKEKNFDGKEKWSDVKHLLYVNQSCDRHEGNEVISLESRPLIFAYLP